MAEWEIGTARTQQEASCCSLIVSTPAGVSRIG